MDKSPVTDRDVNIPPPPYGLDGKFRELRHRAKELEESSHYKKAHRNKRPKEYKYKIGAVFVANSTGYHRGRSSPFFHLVEVLDYKEGGPDSGYYCILQRTTDPDYVVRLGRLITVVGGSWWLSGQLSDANVENKNIKWLLTE